jgi:hypothetical protein
VPVSYLILEDVKALAVRVFGRRVEGPDPEPVEVAASQR